MATAKVIFATITGNNEDVADIITEKFEKLGVDVAKEEISQADATEFNDVDICVVVLTPTMRAPSLKRDSTSTRTYRIWI